MHRKLMNEGEPQRWQDWQPCAHGWHPAWNCPDCKEAAFEQEMDARREREREGG